MISPEDSTPKRGKKYLMGQDIVWSQFNDVNFYVEDMEQENFYFEILKKLFPKIKFERIFPLGGKLNIFTDAALNVGDKKKVYIVDLDFDEILGKKNLSENIFYLEKYSIENYLIDPEAIKKIIIEEKPKVKVNEIDALFDINTFYAECHALFPELISYYLTIQKYELGIENVKCNTARFCNFNTNPASLKAAQINAYNAQIKLALIAKDGRIKLNAQLKHYKKLFKTTKDTLKYTPGKYLLNFIKYRIEKLFNLVKMTLESFTFRLARNCETLDLLFLKESITNYIQ